jgi:ssDNA-binding replication factor A large subunit
MAESISSLKSGQGNVNVEGTIKELGEQRTFNKYGRELKLCNGILEDETGNIKLTLWNDDATRFKEGDKIKVLNGYVSEFQGELQLTSGKFGRIEKVSDEISSNEEKTKEVVDSSSKKKPVYSKKELKKKNEETLENYSEEIDEEENSESDGNIEEEFF